MGWQSYFDRIYVISLLRSDRRDRLVSDFEKYGISFQWWPASKNEDGRKGIWQSLYMLFRTSVGRNESRLLVFEDDVQFLVPPDEFNTTMEEIVRQARMIDWIQIKLGSVLLRPVHSLTTPNLFQTDGSYGLHAVAYSREFMEKALALPESLPVDVCWAKGIESQGKCYHAWPLLAGQYAGYSSIEKEEKNWNYHIQGSFKSHTQKINLLNSGNVLP
jgi:hypothetical protein